MYRIVFFDLDETLLTDEKTVLEENKKAILEVNKLDVNTVICSGRQANAVKMFKDMAGTGRYVICTNGTEIYDYKEDKEVYTCEIDKESVLELYNLAIKEDLLIKIDTPSIRYVNKMKFAGDEEKELTIEIDEILKNNILQISIGVQNEEMRKKINDIVDKHFNIKIENDYVLKCKEEKVCIINIINKEASKGKAILKLCEYLNIDIEDTIAFGDDLNDISMISTVGCGVAMENAKEEIKKIAKEITLTNNEPGIARVLREKILNNREKIIKNK